MVYIHNTHFLEINGDYIYDPLILILWIVYILSTMRVIMDYMYKDHLSTTPFCLLPYAPGPDVSPAATS